MQQYNLQIYTPERDEAALYQLWQRTLGDRWPIDLARLQVVLGGPHAHHLVIREGVQIIGFAATLQGSRGTEQCGYLAALLVDPQAQGRGLGSVLYEAAPTSSPASSIITFSPRASTITWGTRVVTLSLTDPQLQQPPPAAARAYARHSRA